MNCQSSIDYCTTLNPCYNNATCLNQASEALYKCQCAPGFNGTNCDTIIDPCSTNPCQNNGVCKYTGINSFTCICTPQWSGSLCQNPVCVDKPCINGGKCNLTTNTCDCPTGYFGSQ